MNKTAILLIFTWIVVWGGGAVLTVFITRWIFKTNQLEKLLTDISKNTAQTNRLLELLLYRNAADKKSQEDTSEKTTG